MGNDQSGQSEAKKTDGIADLRTQLRTNLAAEFEIELCSAKALSEDQRQSLSKLVATEKVTAQAILITLTPVKKDESHE